MNAPAQGYKLRDGTVIPFYEFHKVGKNFSIKPLKTTFHLRDDVTGQIVKPAGQASHDALMMALYLGELPVGYINYSFGEWGRQLLAQEDPERFSKLH